MTKKTAPIITDLTDSEISRSAKNIEEHKYLTVEQFVKEKMSGGDSSKPATLEDGRKMMEAYSSTLPMPDGWTSQKISLGNVPTLALTGSGATTNGALIFFHAGGYTSGSAATHAGLAAQIANVAHIPAYSVDYRIAPENPFPAAIDDCYAAYAALVEELDANAPIVLAGDSAGGALVITITQMAITRGIRTPTAIYSISPWANLELTGTSYETRQAVHIGSSYEELVRMKNDYLNGHDPKDPLASPIYGSFENFPPLLIDAGANELFLSDAITVADRAANAGVDVQLKAWKGMMHMFPWFYADLKESNDAIEIAGNWIRQQIQNAL